MNCENHKKSEILSFLTYIKAIFLFLCKDSAKYEEIPEFFCFRNNIEIISKAPLFLQYQKKYEQEDRIKKCKNLFQQFLNEIFEKKTQVSEEFISDFLASLKTKITSLPKIEEILTIYHNFIEKSLVFLKIKGKILF